jgi:hypothetical protein
MDISVIDRKALSGLFKALNRDYFLKGTTDIKCPVCGNDFQKIDIDTSYVLKCRTEGCLENGYRGL